MIVAYVELKTFTRDHKEEEGPLHPYADVLGVFDEKDIESVKAQYKAKIEKENKESSDNHSWWCSKQKVSSFSIRPIKIESDGWFTEDGEPYEHLR